MALSTSQLILYFLHDLTCSSVTNLITDTSNSSGNIHESRNGNSVPFEPSVQILHDKPVDELVDISPSLDIDIDHLRDELGLGNIQKTLNVLSDKIIQLSNAGHILPNRCMALIRQRRSILSLLAIYFPTLTGDEPTETADMNQITLGSSEFLPSTFEETDTVGPDVADVIAQRVNNAVSKKPLETKFKELQDKYKSPKSCQLFVRAESKP